MCCVDEITVMPVEADHIRALHAGLLRDGTPHAAGMCAFLDNDGACRIYAQRPYVCRSQGVPLRWTEAGAAGETIEYRDICSLNEAGEPIQDLPAASCWSLGWAEAALAQLQADADGTDPLGFDDEEDDEPPTRVALRDLFSHGAPSAATGLR